MSNRFHNKWHRHNHSTLPIAGEPDSSHDPIASPDDPFKGSFVVNGLISSNDIIYAKCGNSEQWCAAYSEITANSATWIGVTSVNSMSGGITISSGPNINVTNTLPGTITISAVAPITTYVKTLSTLSGDINLTAGPNIRLSANSSTNTIMISGAAGGGVIPDPYVATVNGEGGEINIIAGDNIDISEDVGDFTINANNPEWEYNKYLNFNPHVGLENENTYPIYISNINTSYAEGYKFFVKDSRGREFVFYTSGPGPTQGTILYKAAYSLTDSNKLYLNAEPVLDLGKEYRLRILRFEPDYAIIRVQPISGSILSNYYAGINECRYYLYEFPGANFSTFSMSTATDITPIVSTDVSTAAGIDSYTVNLQLITSGANKFILKSIRSGKANEPRYLDMSLWGCSTCSICGVSARIFCDRGGRSDTLFFLDTALNPAQPLYSLLSGMDGSPPNFTLAEARPHSNLYYIPSAHTIFGDINYTWTFNSSQVRNAAIAVHFDVPQNFLDTGFTNISSLTTVSLSTINFADDTVYTTIDGDNSPANKWGGYNANVNQNIFIKRYQFLFDNKDNLFWCDIPYDVNNAKSRRVTVGPVTSWQGPNRFIYSLSASPFISIEKKYPIITPYDGGLQTNLFLLSSNCIVFSSRGKGYNNDIYADAVSQWSIAELLPERTLISELTSSVYNITAHSLNMKAGTLTALYLNTDTGVIPITSTSVINPWQANQIRQLISTTIDASNDITYYMWPSGGADLNRTQISWPIYKVFPTRNESGSIILSGVFDRYMLNPCNSANYSKFDGTLNPYITSILSSCYIREWGVSGNNTILLLNSNDYKNPDLDIIYGGSWDKMKRIATFNHTTSTFALITTLCMSAYYAEFTPSMRETNFGNNVLVDLSNNVLYYGCNYYNHNRNAIKELTTYSDISVGGSFGAYTPTTFGVLCADGLNLGKYIASSPNGLLPASEQKIAGVHIFSENNPNDAAFDMPSPVIFNNILITPRLSTQYVQAFSNNQIPGLVAYIYDYPLFINGRYYDAPVGSKQIPLDSNATINIYLEANTITGVVNVVTNTLNYDDTYNRVKIATVKTNESGVASITYYKINGYDPGRTLNQKNLDNPVSEFIGTTVAEPSASNIMLRVNVGGKEYGILLWELPT